MQRSILALAVMLGFGICSPTGALHAQGTTSNSGNCLEMANEVATNSDGASGTGAGDWFATLVNFSTSTSAAITSIICLPTTSTDASSGADDMAIYRRRQRRLVATHRDRLAIDFASGGGEVASALAWLQGYPQDSYHRHASVVRADFARIFPAAEDDSEQILSRLEAQIAADPELLSGCTRVSRERASDRILSAVEGEISE